MMTKQNELSMSSLDNGLMDIILSSPDFGSPLPSFSLP